MRRTNFVPAAALSVALAMTLAACEAQKSENPLSPSVAGPIPGVEITAPQMLEPADFETFRTRPEPGNNPTAVTFLPDGTGGVSGLRVSGVTFGRVRSPR